GPMVTALADLPALTLSGVILANELLDNLAFDLLEYRDGVWHDVRVAASGDDDALEEVLVPAPPAGAGGARRLVGGPVSDGARIPRQRAAAAWLSEALGRLEEGWVVVVDY